MKVVIKRKHCIDTVYDKLRDCALYRAIKEQHPDVEVICVAEEFVVIGAGEQYSFDNSDAGYCRSSFAKLKKGDIKEISLTLKKCA